VLAHRQASLIETSNFPERTTPDRAPAWKYTSSARSGVVRSGGGGGMLQKFRFDRHRSRD
jgi:hypothetical protein